MDTDNADSPGEIGRTRKVVFYALTAFLAVGLVTQFWRVNLVPILVWFPDSFVNDFYASEIETFSIHRIHYLALGLSHLLVTFGVVIQLWKPMKWIAPMWQASGAMGVSVVLLLLVRPPLETVPAFVYVVLVMVIVLGFIHPSSALLQFPRPHDRSMTLLSVLAAVPLLVYSFNQTGLQLSGVGADPHWALLHYQMVGEYGIHLTLVALLGSTTLRGWRVTAWWAASIAALMGSAFIVYQNAASSQGAGWGLALLVWAVAYATATERRARLNRPRTERVRPGVNIENRA
jgi:hypothetical protein